MLFRIVKLNSVHIDVELVISFKKKQITDSKKKKKKNLALYLNVLFKTLSNHQDEHIFPDWRPKRNNIGEGIGFILWTKRTPMQ